MKHMNAKLNKKLDHCKPGNRNWEVKTSSLSRKHKSLMYMHIANDPIVWKGRMKTPKVIG